MTLASDDHRPARPPRRRTALLAGAAALLAALAVSACGGSSGPRPPRLPSGHSDLESIIEAEGFLHADPPAALRFFKSLGIDRVRVYVPWGGLGGLAPKPMAKRAPARFDAADPNAYPATNWVVYDRIVRAAAKVEIGLDFTVGPPAPRWAAGPGGPARGIYAADWEPSARDFGQFVRALGKRYGGHFKPPGAASPLPRVNFWSLWNEPNYGIYLAPATTDNGTVEVSPRFYRALLAAGWDALAQTGHTPRTDTILFGETAPHGYLNPGTFEPLQPLRFVRALYCVGSDFRPLQGVAASERGCPSTSAGSQRFAAENPALFDASGFAVHPYPDLTAPTVKTPGLIGNDAADFPALPNVESTLDRAAAAYGRTVRLPIWNTEYGYRTDPPDNATYGLPLPTAAAYLNESEYLSWLDPRLRSYDQYLLTDPVPANKSHFMTGLEFFTGQQKPIVFDAFRMPLWLPRTSAPRRTPLVVWGCVRPAPVTQARTGRPQVVQVQFEPAGSHQWGTVSRLTLAKGSNGYFTTAVRFSGSGAVRLAWNGSGPMLHSRTQAITEASK